MNKTISITLAGMAFNIEEEAYPVLKAYLDRIKRHFKRQEGGAEIVDDIEIRIAELFADLLNENKEVIHMDDVQSVINQMGQPFEMDEDLEDEEPKAYSFEQETENGYFDTEKKIFRNPDDKMLGGVCSGLALYLGVDTLWIRLLFIISFFFLGVGLVPYIILWVVIPEANTTAEKLRMRGRPVNVSNIEETIKDGFRDIRDGIRDTANDPDKRRKAKEGVREVGNVIERSFKGFFQVLTSIFKSAGKVIGIFILLACALGFITMIFSFFSASIVGFAMADVVGVFFEYDINAIISSIAIFIVIITPLVALILLAIRMLVDSTRIKGRAFSMLLVVWILGILTLTTEAIYHGLDFRDEAGSSKMVKLKNPNSKKYYVNVNTTVKGSHDVRYYTKSQFHYRNGRSQFSGDDFFKTNGEFFFKGNVNFKTEPSPDAQFHLTLIQSSRGRNYDAAIVRAETMDYEIEQTDSSIILDPYIAVKRGQVWRNQRVDLILQVPEGGEVIFLNEHGYNNIAMDRLGYYFDYRNKIFEMQNGELIDSGFKPQVSDDGVYEVYNLDNFDKLQIESRANLAVDVQYGREFSVKVLKGISEQDFDIKRRGSRLDVEFDLTAVQGLNGPHLVIVMPSLEALDFSGRGIISLKDFNESEMQINLEGNVEAFVSGQFDYLEGDVHGASSLRANGTCKKANFEISGISKLLAFELISKDVDLEVTGNSNAEVFASDALKADAHGKCEIRYKGHAQLDGNATGMSSIESVN